MSKMPKKIKFSVPVTWFHFYFNFMSVAACQHGNEGDSLLHIPEKQKNITTLMYSFIANAAK